MPILRLLPIVIAAALGLAGCGVRGDLEPPPGAAVAAAPPPEADQQPALPEVPVAADPMADILEEEDEGAERVIQSQRRTRFPPMSDSFILDPLL